MNQHSGHVSLCDALITILNPDGPASPWTQGLLSSRMSPEDEMRARYYCNHIGSVPHHDLRIFQGRWFPWTQCMSKST